MNVLEELEIARISMALWKEKNDGEYINIQSKKHLRRDSISTIWG